MADRPDDILCGEIGSPDGERWSEPVRLSGSDADAVAAMAAAGVLQVREGDDGTRQFAGGDQVGLIVLPSGRRVRVRPKVGGLVLLDWLAYLGECPPVPRWVRGRDFGHGGDVHALLALSFVDELDRLTRHHLRQEYAPARADASTVRGRVLAGALARGFHRLPLVPQSRRARLLDTPHNRLLAAALDRVPELLAGDESHAPARAADLSDAWAGVRRGAGDVRGLIAECRWATPPGYAAAVQLASVILQGYSIDPRGAAGGGAFLISMAGVWERALRRMCHDLRHDTGWLPVPDRQRTKRWDDGPGMTGDPVRWMTADAIVERGGRRWVLDAKYKRDYGNEDRNDRFQMTAYVLAFAAEQGTLVYPSAEGRDANGRVLLAGDVSGESVTVDSVELPMAAGPAACREAMRGWMSACDAAMPAPQTSSTGHYDENPPLSSRAIKPVQ